MSFRAGGVAALCLTTTAAYAGGLDRTGQSVGLLFERGNYAEFSIGQADPEVSGADLTSLNPFGTRTGDVAGTFNQVGAGVKYELNDELSFALIYDQPWGADVSYPPASSNPFDPSVEGSLLLGGTQAFADSEALTALLRYRLSENWSVHGGLRYQRLDGRIALRGLAYGPYSGYDIGLERDGALGWVVGGAYEIPDIALRVALTYQSEIEHDFSSTETLSGLPGSIQGEKSTTTPQSVNLDFQSGIAQDTLLFGSVRWVEHSTVQLLTTPISTPFGTLPSVNLINLDDSVTYNLGVARKLSDKWAASISFGYDSVSGDDLVTPLSPTKGYRSVALGLQYTEGNMKVSGGVRYTDLGDAFAETGTPDTARAEFTGNDAVSFGLRVGFFF